ncbi:hypothetical protein AcW2_007078 [Taiwanofungus camphoratus]|nr:hypothetical protein AcW2_007078 [Antrodia cinnamomea]
MDTSSSEYQESTTIRFEWTVRGLKNVFDSSKGESKSKVTKSVKFGGGRWQILFYANSGNVNSEGHTFVSLYLSSEPTAEERENAVNGKWVREGLFKFGFELRNLQKNVLFNSKEAHDHSFSYRTQNWGWAQFARRDHVYYQSNPVRQQDAFLIICTISSSPTAPVPPPAIPRHPVPKDLLDAMGSLLDDPVYSDVEFILPRRGRSTKDARRIYAARRLLKRVEYFDTMFNTGWAETSSGQPSMDLDSGRSLDTNISDDTSEVHSLARQFEDSDDEDDDDDMLIDTDTDVNRDHPRDTIPSEDTHPVIESGPLDALGSWTSVIEEEGPLQNLADPNDSIHRNVRPKLSHPSTPRSRESPLDQQEPDDRCVSSAPSEAAANQQLDGPKRVHVVVRDVAYATYRAVLYYIYTDIIVFAPLSSSFLTSSGSSARPNNAPVSTPVALSSESQANIALSLRPSHQQVESTLGASNARPGSRREWIAQWERNNMFGRPRPCSAKAVYRLADRLDLQELKQRAFQHIIKSLTVDNVAYEVFSTFSAAFEDVRKVQVRFFLDNWGEIRGSDAMRNVWQQIRLGRHPGFEEVWPVIALNLEFKARTAESTGGDGKDGTAGETSLGAFFAYRVISVKTHAPVMLGRTWETISKPVYQMFWLRTSTNGASK